MKSCTTFWAFCFAFGILNNGSLRASGWELVDRYYTVAYPRDRLILKANETAIVDGTVAFDWGYNWMNLLYKHGTNLPMNVSLLLGQGLDTTSDMTSMPGPAVITLNTNLPQDGPLYTGAAGLMVVRTIHTKNPTVAGHSDASEFGGYHTLSEPADKVTLRANETAIIVGTTNICGPCNWMNILYRKKANDFLNIILPLGLTEGAMPLSGPGVVMLNTNDPNFFGAAYTGALQLKEVNAGKQVLSARYYTLAYPDDRLTLKANETAIIDGTAGYDWAYAWVNIMYKRGTNDFKNMVLPLGLTAANLPLSGPGVIMLNTNDVNFFGAMYTGAVGFRIVRTIDRNESQM